MIHHDISYLFNKFITTIISQLFNTMRVKVAKFLFVGFLKKMSDQVDSGK